MGYTTRSSFQTILNDDALLSTALVLIWYKLTDLSHSSPYLPPPVAVGLFSNWDSNFKSCRAIRLFLFLKMTWNLDWFQAFCFSSSSPHSLQIQEFIWLAIQGCFLFGRGGSHFSINNGILEVATPDAVEKACTLHKKGSHKTNQKFNYVLKNKQISHHVA